MDYRIHQRRVADHLIHGVGVRTSGQQNVDAIQVALPGSRVQSRHAFCIGKGDPRPAGEQRLHRVRCAVPRGQVEQRPRRPLPQPGAGRQARGQAAAHERAQVHDDNVVHERNPLLHRQLREPEDCASSIVKARQQALVERP